MKLRKFLGICAVFMLISPVVFGGAKKEASSGVTITVASVNNPDMVIVEDGYKKYSGLFG
jgi:hypothetical protein